MANIELIRKFHYAENDQIKKLPLFTTDDLKNIEAE